MNAQEAFAQDVADQKEKIAGFKDGLLLNTPAILRARRGEDSPVRSFPRVTGHIIGGMGVSFLLSVIGIRPDHAMLIPPAISVINGVIARGVKRSKTSV